MVLRKKYAGIKIRNFESIKISYFLYHIKPFLNQKIHPVFLEKTLLE